MAFFAFGINMCAASEFHLKVGDLELARSGGVWSLGVYRMNRTHWKVDGRDHLDYAAVDGKTFDRTSRVKNGRHTRCWWLGPIGFQRVTLAAR